MSAHWYPKHQIDTCGAYTGEPRQYLRSLTVEQRPGLLPSAAGGQALLEAQVMEHLGRGSEWWAHPLGIVGLRISAAGTVVCLDRHTTLSNGTLYDMAAYALGCLLPVAEVGTQVSGPLGLRVDRVKDESLFLRSVLAGGRVVLRGQPGTRWRSALREHRAKVASDPAFVPLWDVPRLSAHEQEHIDKYRLTWDAEQRLAWIGSALLRRIVLFETSSSAYSTRSWITGDDWIFELDSSEDVPLDHNFFLSRLLDKQFGLPLEVLPERSHCDCRVAAEQGRKRYECSFDLVHALGMPGVIQLRFRRTSPMDWLEARETFARVGAEVEWLDRVLPAPEHRQPRFLRLNQAD